MKKRILAFVLSVCMVIGLTACSSSGGEAGSESSGGTGDTDEGNSGYVMINKAKDDYLMNNYNGFESYLTEHDISSTEQSPTEATVAAQVKNIDELITQGVSALAINANGDTGFDEVLRKAEEAGVNIVSYDAALNPDLRSVHINQASTEDVGAYMARMGVMAALGVEYESGDMTAELEEALADYDGEEIVIGCLSAGIDAPVQNAWLEAMNAELSKDMYQGKVNPEMDIKYGNDDLTESTTQAQAYLAEDRVDVIVCISTIAMAAACQVYESSGSDVKVTGCGAPSQIQAFMPAPDEDSFDAVCPYIVLWDMERVGAVAACALMALQEGEFDGSIGSTLTMDAWGEYEETTFTVTEASDGGSEIVVGAPIVFDKDNVADWVDRL